MGYFQPNEIYIIKLVKFIFLELGSNYLFSYIFHFLDIYYNFMMHRLIMSPTDNTSEIIGTLTILTIGSRTSVCIRFSACPSPISTFWVGTWEVGSENLYFYILFDSKASTDFFFEYATLRTVPTLVICWRRKTIQLWICFNTSSIILLLFLI